MYFIKFWSLFLYSNFFTKLYLLQDLVKYYNKVSLFLRDNKLSYSLVEDGEWWDDFFYMTTEADSSSSSVGVLRLKQVFIGLQGPWPEKQFPPRITQLKEEFAPLMI